MSLSKILIIAGLVLSSAAQAQAPAATASTSGTMVIVPASAEVKHANDEATVVFAVEEHDKDKNAAAARVNTKMKQGTEIVRRVDPTAELQTIGYYTVPVYPEPPPRPVAGVPTRPVPIAWRVGQYLHVKTRNLAGLPKLAAAAQKVLSINDINFGLAPETTKLLDQRRIADTYRNLNERIASIARAMGRSPADAVIDTVDFEGSGKYVTEGEVAAAPAMMRARQYSESQPVPEPSFEPGETTLQMRLVGKVKFR